jgi:hypothetical protein
VLKFIIYICGLFCFHQYTAQSGCTDANALNYNSLAVQNNGSCLYQATNLNAQLVCNVDLTLAEASGIILHNNLFWSHNDSGGDSKIFALDTISGTTIGNVTLSCQNIDWEDITQSATHVFIGDFGNNLGIRTDLKIYYFPKSALTIGATIIPDSILFQYQDQVSFTTNNNTNFDCEAFIFFNDSLHLFTKNWGNGYTNRYIIPATAGNYTPILKDSFFVDGLVTGASKSEDGKNIALIGYKTGGLFPCFSYLFSDFSQSRFFSGNKRKFNLGSAVNLGQTEGIVMQNNGTFFTVSEKVIAGPNTILAKMHRFEFTLPGSFASLDDGAVLEVKVKDRNISVMHLESQTAFSILDIHGKNIKTGSITSEENTITFDAYTNGCYFLKIGNQQFKFVIVNDQIVSLN